MLQLRKKIASQPTDPKVKWGKWFISKQFPAKEFSAIAPPEKQPAQRGVDWKIQSDFIDGKITPLKTKEFHSVYLFRNGFSDQACEVQLSLGSDDGIALWVNDKKVLYKDAVRPTRANQENVIIKLKKGENTILMKVHNKKQGSGFFFQQTGISRQHYVDKMIMGLINKFPIECDWLNQDSPHNGNISKGENNNFKQDFHSYFKLERDTGFEARIIANAIAGLKNENRQKYSNRLKSLSGKPVNDSVWLNLYAEVCRLRRSQRLKPLLGKTTKVIFAKHHVFGSRSRILYITETEGCYGKSSLCTIDLSPEKKGKFATTSTLFDAKDGIVRDPELSCDGKKLLFAWRQSREHIATRYLGVEAPPTGNYQIYEMELANGKIRQLTTDETYGANYEPCYLPNDDIVFSSARIVQHITCGWGDCSNLFIMNKDGKYARRIGFDQTNTNFPALTNDGRIIFTRRDYNDRGQSSAHALFQMKADGTGQTEMYGNQTGTPNSFTHARSIPNSNKLMCIIGGYHTTQGGKMAIMDVTKGRQKSEGLIQIPEGVRPPSSDGYNDWYGKQGVQYSNPYPLSNKHLIVARSNYHNSGYKIYYMTTDGQREVLAHDPNMSCLQPIPVMPRKRPPMRPSVVDHKKASGVLFLQDAYFGAAMKGVKRGTIKKIRVVEILYKYDTIGWGLGKGPGGCWHTVTNSGHPLGSFDAKRIIGDATVYPDGSAMFRVPSRIPFYLQLLDAKNRVVQTMRSWATLMPGENFSCVGCHEDKNSSPVMGAGIRSLAMKAGVEELKPFYGPARGFRYMEHVQPIFDKHCVSCHNPEGKAKKLDLRCEPKIYDPDSKKEWARSYYFLTKDHPGPNPAVFACRSKIWNVSGPAKPTEPNKYVNWWTRFELMGPQPPYRAGSITSGLVKMLDKGHKAVKLTEEEMDKLCAWIDLNIPYCGSYMESNRWNEKELNYHLHRIEERKRNKAIEAENIQRFITAGQPQ